VSVADGFCVDLGAGLLVDWDLDAVRGLAGGSEDAERPWRISGDLEPARIGLVRVLAAGFRDGTAIGVAAARPAGAAGHGDEVVRAVLARAEATPEQMTQTLLSTEYDRDGRVRRAGLELYPTEACFPLRAAADGEPGGSGEPVPMRFRLDGVEGRGSYELRRLD
jgi:hypothetical protein